MSHIKIVTPFHWPLIITTTIISLSTLSCSKTPDVRLTLCQDLTVLSLNSPSDIEWQEDKAIIKGYEDLEMKAFYSLANATDQSVYEASCFYQYEQDDIGMDTFNTPTAAYSTYPNKMILNGQTMNKKELAKMVEQVMLKQGGELYQKAKEKLKEGADLIKEEINNK